MYKTDIKQVLKQISDNRKPNNNYVYFRKPGDKASFRVLLPRDPSRKLLRQVRKLQIRCGCLRHPQPRTSPTDAKSCLGELGLWLLASLSDILSGKFN